MRNRLHLSATAAAHRLRHCLIAASTLVLAGMSTSLQAQTPVHKHYEHNEAFDTPAPSGAVAPRLQNVGKHTFEVTTKSEQAQRFMSQGLNLTYGFNHAEAGRAFAEAARLDPDLAMAYWGQALVLGPNINAPMPPEDEEKALKHIRKAQSLKPKASQRERDYIDALAVRYTGKADDRAAADQAYAGAMRTLHEKYPDDLDAATLYAESVMDLRPWNYWTRDGQPYAQTHDIIKPLDKVLATDPDHPGALHYWIHLWEASNTPEKAEAAADRLLPLAPGAGHLVHMPGHLFQRVGRYSDAVKANQMAIVADEDYITQCKAQGLYPMAYYPHNVHFLWFAASMNGESRLAIDAANKTAAAIPPEALKDVPLLQTFMLTPDYALVRFGKWDEILAAPAPRADTLFTRGVRHYARGMALIRKKDLAGAAKEIDAVRTIARDPKLIEAPTSMSLNLADSVLRVAIDVLDGELAAAQGSYDKAIAHLDRAVRYQDALIYTEPDDWHQPVRHNLGAVLLEAKRPVEAESVYWDDLRMHPKNGWALYGLAQAMRAQGKNDQARLAEADFKKAWANADVTLTASRF
jgi:tetratricopeptide (TPR) repeat protein